MIVYRVAQWYPELVSHIFAVCTPYQKPSDIFISTEDLVRGPLPQFGYQLHLASGEVESAITSREDISQFLNGMYGGKVPDRKYFLSPTKGVDLSLIGKVGKSPLFTDDVCQCCITSP